MAYTSISPLTLETIASYPLQTTAQVSAILQTSQSYQQEWKKSTTAKRIDELKALPQVLLANKEVYAQMITDEMGKPISQSIAEIEKCAVLINFYLDRGAEYLTPKTLTHKGESATLHYHPLGVILGVMPWNFPFWQAIRFAVPTILAGNTVCVKHAPNVTGCNLQIAGLFEQIGRPELYQVLITDNDQTAQIIADDRIKGVGFTGSEATGRIIGGLAGQAIKPCVLELGGSDPFIIHEDADIQAATKVALQSRIFNSGQTCISAKRFLVHRSHRAAFREHLINELKGVMIQDPNLSQTKVGTLSRTDILEKLRGQVKMLMQNGARVLAEQNTFPVKGLFHPVLFLENIPDIPTAKEELFGPVGMVFYYDTIDEAIALANSTPYGLGAAVWTNDESAQTTFTQYIEAGTVTFNDMVKSNPSFPFGGTKASGVGRELGAEGIRTFTNHKTVVR